MPAQHFDAVRRVSRRRLLQFLAASPLALNNGRLGDVVAHFQGNVGPQPARAADSERWRASSPHIEDALNVFDFEAAAQRTLPPAHFGYLTTGNG